MHITKFHSCCRCRLSNRIVISALAIVSVQFQIRVLMTETESLSQLAFGCCHLCLLLASVMSRIQNASHHWRQFKPFIGVWNLWKIYSSIRYAWNWICLTLLRILVKISQRQPFSSERKAKVPEYQGAFH